MPSVSVVVCSRNGGALIAQTVRALRDQDYRGALELVVVDDGSTDDTGRIVRATGGTTLLTNERNLGLAASRNRGARHAAGEIVAFTDDDCRPAPDWIGSLVRSYEDPSVLAVGGPTFPSRSDTAVLRYLSLHNPLAPLPLDIGDREAPWQRLRAYGRRLLESGEPTEGTGGGRVFAVAGANLSVRRAALSDLGWFDERFRFGGEDEDLCRRLNEAHPGSVWYTPTATVLHEFEPGLLDTLRRSVAYGRGNARVHLKLGTGLPTVYPTPLALIALTALLARRGRVALLPVALVPLAYPRWITPRGRGAGPEVILYPFIELLQESASNLGLVLGLVQLRRTFRGDAALTTDVAESCERGL